MFRQGDLLITKVNRIPDGCKKINSEDGKLIVARGEKTGHHHSFDDDGSVALLDPPTKFWGDWDGQITGKVVQVTKKTELVHQEHDPIPLEPGYYEIRYQRQHDPKNNISKERWEVE